MFQRVRRMFSAMFNWMMGKTESQMTIPMLERAEREAKVKKERVKTLQMQAEEALRQGNEKLARRALQLQMEAQAEMERADTVWKASKIRADAARAKLKVEEEKVQDKIRKLGELKAVAAMNDAQKRMLEITDRYNIDGAMTTFDSAAQAVQDESDKLAAHDKLMVSEGEELD